jgi:hypothetical protein
MSPVRQIAFGVLISLAGFGGLAYGCAGGQLSPLVQCKLDALKVLPADPLKATVYDAIDVIERLQACHRPDAGAAP